jgi:hypothetical protein
MRTDAVGDGSRTSAQSAPEPIRARSARTRAATLRRDLRECLLFPAIAILLPWSLAWRVLRTLARRGRAFAQEADAALAACRAQGLVADEVSWASSHRLMRIVDHVDPALSFFRRDRYLDRHVVVDADALPAAPCLFVGFHYGTAFWALRHLRRLGYRASFLAANVTARQCPGQPLRLRFMRFRKRCVERASGAPVILVGGSRERIASALRAGTSVVGLIDVPEASHATSVELLGQSLQWPDGLLQIAQRAGVPVVAFIATLDASGARRIRLRTVPADPARAMAALAALLDDAVRSESSGWHLWAEWTRFLPVPAGTSGKIKHLRVER